MNRSGHKIYGLIGYPLVHSFSKAFFSQKFERENLTGHRYELFPLAEIGALPTLLLEWPNLVGLNVTIPHKQTVIPFLDQLDEKAKAIGAVNVIKIMGNHLSGHNSDAYGFERSLLELLGGHLPTENTWQALVLGTGGASKAVTYVLVKLGIPYRLVSRSPGPGLLTYSELTPALLEEHRLVVNCTPLGTFPQVDQCPELPYRAVSERHFFYDLVYNPAETLFLQKAKAQGARTCNGLAMLHLQAERAWEIWEGE